MKRIIFSIMIALLTCNAIGQTLSVAPIEAQMDEGTELVVSLAEGTTMTALQFNLTLPEGMSLAEGTTSESHTLCIEPLASGAYLFVLYSEDQKTFTDGEVIRIPLTAGSEAMTATGTLTKVRTATVNAVSHTCADATFAVTVNETATGIGEVPSTKDKTQRNEVYDLNGRRVEYPTQGIHIIDGRKVMVK